MKDLEFLVLFVYQDANYDKYSGRLDFPMPLLKKPRCVSSKCNKKDKCLLHKLPSNNGRTKECGGYIKFKYQGETYFGPSWCSDEIYFTSIYSWILKAYKNYYGYPEILSPEILSENTSDSNIGNECVEG